MTNGSAQLPSVGNLLFLAAVLVGSGKRIRKRHSGYRTKKEAEAARIELLGAVAGGTYVAPSRLTLGAFSSTSGSPPSGRR